jgi:hypothetical protein
MFGDTRWSERPPETPFTKEALEQFDSLTALEAVTKAWSDPGKHPAWHYRMQQIVRTNMPALGRALDRLTVETNQGDK